MLEAGDLLEQSEGRWTLMLEAGDLVEQAEGRWTLHKTPIKMVQQTCLVVPNERRQAGKPSILQSFSELSDPDSLVEIVFETNPESQTQLAPTRKMPSDRMLCLFCAFLESQDSYPELTPVVLGRLRHR